MTSDSAARSPDDRHPRVDAADLADLDRLDALTGPADLAELVGAEAVPGPVVRLRGGGDLVSALPVLLGFHPEESLVLVGIGGRSGGRVGLTVRVDLPRPADAEELCAQAVGALLSDHPSGGLVVVVGGGAVGGAAAGDPPGTGLPRADVAATMQHTLVEAGIVPHAVVWAAGTGRGRAWACYDLPGQRCGCRGVLPDPAATPAAAAAVRQGKVVLPDRAAMEGLLAADEEPALHRRAALRAAELARAGERVAGGADPGPERAAEHHAVLRAALDAAARGRLAVDDRTVLEFCAAFDVPAVRDEAVRCCLGPQAPHAEQLWAALFRAMPAPECAEPAALLATCALLRGDGALAGIAVERALDAFPAHRLAGIVDAMLRGLAGPGPLRRLLEQAYGRPRR